MKKGQSQVSWLSNMAGAPDPFCMREICQKAATPPKFENEILKSSNKKGQAFARA